MKLFGFIAALTPAIAFAQAAPAASAQQAPALMSMLPLVLIFGVFYLLLIRPQQRRQKELELMQLALKRGDEVITAGGALGKYLRDGDNGTAVIEIAPGVEIRIVKSTISSILKKGETAAQPKKKIKADTLVKNDNVVPDKDQVANDN